MYMNYKSAVSVGGYFGHPFSVRVGVHHGSILCPLLFIISMDQVSKDYKKGLRQELLDADDLALWADNLQDLEAQYTAWKQAMNTKGLSVKINRTKIMVSHMEVKLVNANVAFVCSV